MGKKHKHEQLLTKAGCVLMAGCLWSLMDDLSVVRWNGQKRNGGEKRYLLILLAGGIMMKLYMQKKLREIDGLGEIYTKTPE